MLRVEGVDMVRAHVIARLDMTRYLSFRDGLPTFSRWSDYSERSEISQMTARLGLD